MYRILILVIITLGIAGGIYIFSPAPAQELGGQTSEDVLNALVPSSTEIYDLTFEQFQLIRGKHIQILDARSEEAFHRGHIPGAESVYFRSAGMNRVLSDIDKDHVIVTYCLSRSCPMAMVLARTLKDMGFSRVAVFTDGLRRWEEEGGEINF